MSTPSSFYLETPNPASRPPPFPPKFFKRQIYNDPSVFKVIDDHSINVRYLYILYLVRMHWIKY